MHRVLIALVLLPLISQAQQRPRKIFISVDMEGITGVVQPAQLGPDGFEYQRAREWMTGAVNAAIAATRESGPVDTVVCDHQAAAGAVQL
jgi:D-amino peptidase